ncbi:hypothetical protein [Brevibacillus sp. SYSU BS000544]|uniref:hypothetical protein n=1 Tax=Brevibacillus sp. SYSU BS000544 TaxID=3416443 RepID=UPI003CE5A971
MRRQLNFITIVILSCLWALFSSQGSVSACSCGYPPPSPQKSMENVDFVFAGTVKEIRRTRMGMEVLFDVRTTWKGIDQTQVLVMTGMGGGDCGYEFEKGKEYIVYGGDYDPFEGKLSTNVCMRTREISKAGEDLLYLGEGAVPTEKVNLEHWGAVWYLAGAVAVFGFLLYRIGKAIR